MDLQNHIKGFSVALFENQVASGESLPFEYMLGTQMINVYVTGDLGGGSITFEAIAPNGVFTPVAGDPITEPGMYTFEAFQMVGKAVLAGATGANVSMFLQGTVRIVPA